MVLPVVEVVFEDVDAPVEDVPVDVVVLAAAAVKLIPVTLAWVTGAGRFAGVKVRALACGATPYWPGGTFVKV